MINTLLGYNWWALLVLRLAVGLIFIAHGWPKIKNLKSAAQNFEMMGFKPGSFWGTLAAVLEFFGGLLLIAGWFTQLIGLLLAIEMAITTIWKMKGGQKIIGGFELDLILLASALMLATSGGGYFALDNYLPITLY